VAKGPSQVAETAAAAPGYRYRSWIERQRMRRFAYRVFRVRAALRAAARRPAVPLVREAFLAAALRLVRLRCRAAVRACRASAGLDADRRGSRRSAPLTARDRPVDGPLDPRRAVKSRRARRRVAAGGVLAAG